MAANEQKWERISLLCGREGVSRDAEQCRKRWQDLSKNYKRIKEWDGAAEVPSFWLMSSASRKNKNLPANFDKDVFDYMHVFMGLKAAAELFSTKASADGNQELVNSSLDGGSSALVTHAEPHGEPSSQEDSWALSKEPALPSRDYKKHMQSSQADSGNDRGDPISEAVENATRLALEQCSAQVTEVLAKALLKMSDAMKTVAESIRKRPR